MQFELWQVVALAVVQGVAEFLPISSDGHLVVLAPLLFGGRTPPPMLDLTIVLHLGTLASILVFYRRRLLLLLSQDRRVIGRLVVGTLPAVVLVLTAKLLFDAWFEPVLQSPLLAGLMLPVTGAIVLWTQRQSPGTREYRDLTYADALLIGAAQAAAILPGLSRSGSTIAAGVGRHLTRPAATTYSFLLAVPALAGAGVYEAASLLKDREPLSASPMCLAIGASVAFFVGLVALAWLERWVRLGRLHWFGWYCIALGAAVIAWQVAAGQAP